MPATSGASCQSPLGRRPPRVFVVWPWRSAGLRRHAWRFLDRSGRRWWGPYCLLLFRRVFHFAVPPSALAPTPRRPRPPQGRPCPARTAATRSTGRFEKERARREREPQLITWESRYRPNLAPASVHGQFKNVTMRAEKRPPDRRPSIVPAMPGQNVEPSGPGGALALSSVATSRRATSA